MDKYATSKKHKKQVTFLLSAFYGGGGEKVVLELAQELAHQGLEVDIVVLQRRGAFADKVPHNVAVVNLKAERMAKALVPLARYLRHTQPDAILATGIHTNILLMLARFLSFRKTRIVLRVGIPLSIVFSRYTHIKDSFLVPLLSRLLYPLADGVIAVSHGIADDLARVLYLNPDKITIIYNPISIEKLKQKSDKSAGHPWLTDKKIPVVVVAGRLRFQKGFDVLIKAIALLNKDNPVRLIILGEGDGLNDLKEKAKALGVFDRVDFMGFVPKPYVFMALADVFVLSSRWEGFPNVLIEAMALGVPVVATDCISGPREILAPTTKTKQHTLKAPKQGAFGILVPSEDAESMAEAIKLLINDPRLREHYKQKGRMRARDFSSTSIVPQYRTLFGV